MIEHKEHFHGSDLEKIEAIYGIKKEDITSFSANVNPLGISYKLREGLMEHIDAITTYPDREYTSLRKCIAEYTGTDYRNILVGNGSTELISLVIQLKHPKKALIVGPTYSEYESGGRPFPLFPFKRIGRLSVKYRRAEAGSGPGYRPACAVQSKQPYLFPDRPPEHAHHSGYV